MIAHLQRQATIFGNPHRIISDRGSAFTSHEFEDYCKQEKIHRHLITTGIPRANGQVERLNRMIIPLLTKLAAPRPHEWFKYLSQAQQCINTTWSRSTGTTTTFKLLFGVCPRMKDDPELTELFLKEMSHEFDEERNNLREQAHQIFKKSNQKIKKDIIANEKKLGNTKKTI